MTIREYIESKGKKLPEKRNEFNSANDIFRAPNKGFNDAIDAFQTILDMEIGEGLDEKAVKKWYEDNNWQHRFGTSFSDLMLMNDFIKSLCATFSQPSQTLRPINELTDGAIASLLSGHRQFCGVECGEERDSVEGIREENFKHVAKSIGNFIRSHYGQPPQTLRPINKLTPDELFAEYCKTMDNPSAKDNMIDMGGLNGIVSYIKNKCCHPPLRLPSEAIEHGITNWLSSAGESRLTPDDVKDIAKAILAEIERNK